MKDKRIEKAGLIVTATGYEDQLEVARRILGDEIADAFGLIWGWIWDGELANICRLTLQKRFWFMGGGFAQARIYSHYVAVQIKARACRSTAEDSQIEVRPIDIRRHEAHLRERWEGASHARHCSTGVASIDLGPDKKVASMKLLRVFGLMVLMAAGAAGAQGYPDKAKPLKMIVPFGTGTAADLLARALAKGMTEVAGLTVVIDNRPGAETVVGVVGAKNAPPDGYTMLFTNTGSTILNVYTLPSLPYDPVADFRPLAGVARFSLVMSAGPSQNFASLQEVLDAARAAPGKYTYGSATAVTRVAMEMLEQLAGVKMLSVPYKAMSEATTALAGGQIDFLMNDAATAITFYKSGRLRPLATTATTRMAALPNVPTVLEAGVKDYELVGWFATYFPANTPPAVTATMREILQRAVKTKSVVDMLASASFEPMDVAGDQLGALQRSDSAKWGKLLRNSVVTGK